MLKTVVFENYTSVIVRKNGRCQQCIEFTLSLGFNFFNFPEETKKSILIFLFVLMCRFQLMGRKSREHRTLMKEVLAADKRYQSQSC